MRRLAAALVALLAATVVLDGCTATLEIDADLGRDAGAR